MVSRFKTNTNGGRGQGPNRLYHCGCCAPPRQIYYQARGRLELAKHESDHTPATSPVSLAARRRMLREK